MASSVPPRPIAGLDLVRFVAALMVMAWHLGFASWAVPGSAMREIVAGAVAFPGLAPLVASAWVGVEIFFVLSGVVIAMAATGATASGFARNRLARLYPGAWICGTISLLVLLALGQGDLGERYGRTLLLWPSGPWVAAVYWTLAHEMAFYFLIFLLLAAGRARNLVHLLSALGLASTIYLLLVVMAQDGSLPPALDGLVRAMLAVPLRYFLGFGCFFALGGLLCLSLREGWTAWRGAVILACAAGCLLRIVRRSAQMGEAAGMTLDPLAPAALWTLGIAAMAAALILARRRPSRGGKSGTALREAGLATYPLYLLHAPLGGALLLWMGRAGVAPGVALALASLLVLALSFAISRWLERPLQASARRAWNRAGARFAVLRTSHADGTP